LALCRYKIERTTEAIQIIKKLWNKEISNGVFKGIRPSSNKNDDNMMDNDDFVNFNGQYFSLKNAKL
jgi:alkanesulfonate monooxygenase SsuD/methylene tetrahydromethanopterin reductase-like flavin-dependent oxidoreductase (luciferase family)